MGMPLRIVSPPRAVGARRLRQRGAEHRLNVRKVQRDGLAGFLGQVVGECLIPPRRLTMDAFQHRARILALGSVPMRDEELWNPSVLRQNDRRLGDLVVAGEEERSYLCGSAAATPARTGW